MNNNRACRNNKHEPKQLISTNIVNDNEFHIDIDVIPQSTLKRVERILWKVTGDWPGTLSFYTYRVITFLKMVYSFLMA